MTEYCYSTDEERYHGTFSTKDDAVGSAIDALEGDSEDFWIAEVTHPIDAYGESGLQRYIADTINEQMEEVLSEEISADESPLDISKEDKEELGRMVVQFYRDKAKVQYFGIKNPERHKHSTEVEA